jgi:hypothetical protein
MASKWPKVETPVPARLAFTRTDPEAVLSQAALLLTLGAQARGDEEMFNARSLASGTEKIADFLPDEDRAVFGRPAPRAASLGGRIDVQRLRDGLARRFGDWIYPERPQTRGAVNAGAAAALPQLRERC